MVRRGTYSIVARDPGTGELGAAVQSHWFSVGSIVTWARPGVGAVATQSIAEPAYGPRLLDRIDGGEGPPEAPDALRAPREGPPAAGPRAPAGAGAPPRAAAPPSTPGTAASRSPATGRATTSASRPT